MLLIITLLGTDLVRVMPAQAFDVPSSDTAHQAGSLGTIPSFPEDENVQPHDWSKVDWDEEIALYVRDSLLTWHFRIGI